MFDEFMGLYGNELFYTLVTAVFGFLGIQLKAIYEKWIDTKVKKEVAHTVVMAVEQLYKNLEGDKKLDKAYDYLIEMLAEKGITVTELEARMLLEGAVGTFNECFKEGNNE